MTHSDFREYAIRRAIQDCDDTTTAKLQAAIDPDVRLGNHKPMGNIHIMGLDHDGIPLTHVMCCRDIYELSYLADLVDRNRDAIAAIPGAEGVLRAMDEAPAEVLKGLRDACCDICPHDMKTICRMGHCELCDGCDIHEDGTWEEGIMTYFNESDTLHALDDWIKLYRPRVRDDAVIADAKALCRSIACRYPWNHDFEDLMKNL